MTDCYKEMKFADLVQMAQDIENISPEPSVLVPIFEEFATLVLRLECYRICWLNILTSCSHVLSTMDQERSRTYVAEVIGVMKDRFTSPAWPASSKNDFALVKLAQVVLSAFMIRVTMLADLSVLSGDEFIQLAVSAKEASLSSLTGMLLAYGDLKDMNSSASLFLSSTIDLLTIIGVEYSDLAALLPHASICVAHLSSTNIDLGLQLSTFFASQKAQVSDTTALKALPAVEPVTALGRLTIHKQVEAITEDMDHLSKEETLFELLQDRKPASRLTNLLMLSDVIKTFDGNF